MFLLTILKDLLNLDYKKKCESKLRNVFSLNLQHDICQFWWHQNSLKQNLLLQFCRSRNKDVNVLTETHINLDQIHHMRNDWLGAIFFCPGNSHTEGLFVLFLLGLESVTEIGTYPKGRFVSF